MSRGADGYSVSVDTYEAKLEELKRQICDSQTCLIANTDDVKAKSVEVGKASKAWRSKSASASREAKDSRKREANLLGSRLSRAESKSFKLKQEIVYSVMPELN